MSTQSITLIATFQARPGKERELHTALTGLISPTRKERGCLNYDLHTSPIDPAKFLFHENWTDQAAIDSHMQSPHIQALFPRVGELCVEAPQITAWARLPI